MGVHKEICSCVGEISEKRMTLAILTWTESGREAWRGAA